MVDLKRLCVLEKKLDLALDLVTKTKHEIKEELDFLRRSHYRDMKDRWQFNKDIGHPVTGIHKPSDQLLFDVFYYEDDKDAC